MVVEGYMDVIAWLQACATPSPPWHGHRRRTPSACFASYPAYCSASTATTCGREQRGVHWSRRCQTCGMAVAHAFCFCLKAKIRTLWCAASTDAFMARIQQHAQPLADYFPAAQRRSRPALTEGKPTCHVGRTTHRRYLAQPPRADAPALSEITGLHSEAVQQMSASSPNAARNTMTASITTQAPRTTKATITPARTDTAKAQRQEE